MRLEDLVNIAINVSVPGAVCIVTQIQELFHDKIKNPQPHGCRPSLPSLKGSFNVLHVLKD